MDYVFPLNKRSCDPGKAFDQYNYIDLLIGNVIIVDPVSNLLLFLYTTKATKEEMDIATVPEAC